MDFDGEADVAGVQAGRQPQRAGNRRPAQSRALPGERLRKIRAETAWVTLDVDLAIVDVDLAVDGPAHHHTLPSAGVRYVQQVPCGVTERERRQPGAVARYSCRRIQKQSMPGSLETTTDITDVPGHLYSLRFCPAISRTHDSWSLRSCVRASECQAEDPEPCEIPGEPRTVVVAVAPAGVVSARCLFRSGVAIPTRAVRRSWRPGR